MLAVKAHKGFGSLLLLTVLFSLFLCCQSAFAAQDEVDHVNNQIWNNGAKWWAAETSVSQLPPDVRKKRLIPDKPVFSAPAPDSPKLTSLPPPLAAPAGSLNYVNYNYVTPVRDQGNCGSCWAFATAAALESQVIIGTNASPSQIDFAEQVLISCSAAGDCGGGYIDTASDFIQTTGLPLEACFPNINRNASCSGAACLNWRTDTYGIPGWHWVSTGTPTIDTIKNALYTYGPLVVSLRIYGDFYTYAGGVYSHVTGTYQGGHAVELVGYDDSLQCFIVKNSWGARWGESGFFRIAYSQVGGSVQFGQYTIAYEGYKHASSDVVASTAFLAADFGSQGLRVLQNGTWTQLKAASPDKMTTYGQKLVASFTGDGIYEYDGATLTRISGNGNLQNMVAGDSVYVDAGSGGLWQWNGAWSMILGANPANMVASGSVLFADLAPWGLWQWNGSYWTHILDAQPVSMTASGTNLFANFGASGLWQWNGSAWSRISSAYAQNMVVSGSNLYVDFAPWGLWRWNGTSWAQINNSQPLNMFASGANLYANYGTLGLWQWDGSSWGRLTNSAATDMTMSSSNLCASFGNWGVWQLSGGAWSMLSPLNPEKIVGIGN